jgi:protein TonB
MQKLKKNDFFTFLIISVLLHLFVLYSVLHIKMKPVYLSAPIDVVFYSSSQKITDQSANTSKEAADVDEKDRGKEILNTTEEVKSKEDVVVKRKEKSKIQPKKDVKKAEKKIVKQIKEKKIKTNSKVSGNNGNIETFQSHESKDLSVSTGAQYSGLSFDTQNFKFSYYSNQIVRKISSQWRWAESYGKLRAVIYFKINKDGTAFNISIKESSGNSDYDRNALDTIRRASPFPMLPEDYTDESLGVFFEFKYRN